MKLHISFLALLFSGISFASQDITFHEAGNNTYVIELISSNNIGEQKGLEIIANAATKKCGDMPAHFGKHRFEGKEQVSSTETEREESFRMIQQLFCGKLASVAQETTKPLSTQEKNKLEIQARKLTDLYLDYLSRIDFKKAYSLLSSVLKQDQNYQEWGENKKQLTRQPGQLLRSEVWGITTYIDPPPPSRKGVYIATDFDREYTKSPIFCGYLVWYLEGNELRLIREDIGSINSSQYSQMNADDLGAIKSKFRCKPFNNTL